MPHTESPGSDFFVEKTASLEIVPINANMTAADLYIASRVGLSLSSPRAAIVGLRRSVLVHIPQQGYIVHEDWGSLDESTPRRHSQLNRCMDRRAQELAYEYGGEDTPLPVVDAWGSLQEISRNNQITFTEPEVFAGHVALYMHATYRLNSQPDLDVTQEHRIYINTDDMDRLPLSRFDLIGIGAGYGTSERPDWSYLHSLVGRSATLFDTLCTAGENPEDAYSEAIAHIDDLFDTMIG